MLPSRLWDAGISASQALPAFAASAIPASYPADVATQTKSTALPSAALLACSAGLLDALIYLDHGRVFVNAMTGNVIFLGIAFAGQDWPQVLRHLSVIAGFLLGLTASRFLRGLPVQHSAIMTLSLEILALFLTGLFSPGLPQVVLTSLLAFVSAFQVATFRRVGRFNYNSTFITGNLRTIVEGTFDHFTAKDPAKRWFGRQKAQDIAVICLGYLLGAIGGGILAPAHHPHAIWFAEPMLLLTLALILWRPVALYPEKGVL